MRILLTTHQGDIAGSTYSMAYLCEGLARRGHYVVVGCRENALLYELLADTPVHRVPMRFGGRMSLRAIRELAQVVRQHRIEILNPQSGKTRHQSAYARWLYGLSYRIVHTRRQRPFEGASALRGWFVRQTADCIVAVSEGVKTALIQMGIPADMIVVIHNGTPAQKYQLPNLTERVTELRTQLELNPGQPVIGCVSRPKQQEQLLEALNHLPYPVTLILIGVSQMAVYECIQSSYIQPHRVIYLGNLPGQEVLYHYGLFDLKVLPSNMEGLSQSLLEAMAMGVPVVATRASGNPDLIQDGQNGLLFDEGDTQTLSQHIQSLLADADLRERLRAAGRKTARIDFSIEKVIDRYEELFEKNL